MWKVVKSLILALFLALILTQPVMAAEGQVLGIHILNPGELEEATALIQPQDSETWQYVTIPLSLNDLEKQAEWQAFFNKARDKKVIPLVRLTSSFENGAWKVPNRKEITRLVGFLSALNWPTDQKHIIVFNEVNHAKEWGNRLDPAEYGQVLRFTAEWAHSEQKNYVVLPAAMDLAAPNGSVTREAFTYLNQMVEADPEILTTVDAWNSHSYPNPGFSASPQRTAQNSLRGFEFELAFLKQKTGRDYPVFITETGWVVNRQTSRWLASYYEYAMQHIWSHPQVVAVTPFVLRGDPGPFSGFTFLDKNNKPTVQYEALQKALTKFNQKS
jgi:hypothetical protein